MVITGSWSMVRLEFKMAFNWVWTRSPVIFIWRRTWRSPGLASSATSSSEMMQRVISLFTLVSGSRERNISSRESSGSSDSWRRP